MRRDAAASRPDRPAARPERDRRARPRRRRGLVRRDHDKVVTNAGFIIIAFFPLLILSLSLLQGAWTSARTPASRPRRRAARAPTGAAAGSRRGRRGDEVRYERLGAAAVLTIDRPERRNAVDGPTARRCTTASARFEADDEARVLVLTGAGGEAFCAGADLKAIETLGRARPPGGPARLHPPDLAEADDRRDRGLVPRRRPRARALVRPADRDPELDLRLPRAPLGRAADRRRHPAPAADRRHAAARST